VLVYALIALPLSAERPPFGYARPPIHVRGNATTSPTGYNPNQIRTGYGFPTFTTSPSATMGAGQTIAIVDAYDDPNIESDLGVFSSTFGLPACTTSNGCFSKVYASGATPSTNAGWALEISLDVEWAHAMAPQAKILLVEAASNSYANLFQAVDYAAAHASVVSMSWGGGESSGETSYDNHFNVSNVLFTASSGDSGNGVEYPAASPYVVGVGGTTLKSWSCTSSTCTYGSETAWSGSGGGQSAVEGEPTYQRNYGISSSGKRGVPDVSYDADPNTGFPVYDSVRYQGQKGWFQVGGTSAGAPQWAALIAVANAERNAAGKATLTQDLTLNTSPFYTIGSSNYHDITSGSNGNCGAICTATTGYDFVTGIGTPKVSSILSALVGL
jgi:subtilase family serine protease